jgi:hypothetical protein
MNVVIMQPFYLFLRKHFHQIQRSNLYIFMDDTQFVKNGHHNRNRIKGPNGYVWLTVPVYHKFGQKLNEVVIDNTKNWRKKHWESIKQCYSKAKFFKNYADFFEDVYKREWEKLVDINIYLIINISQFLGIETKFIKLSELNIQNDNPTQRLIDICEHVGATNYIIGTRAKDYMEEWRWQFTKVNLEYFEPKYPPYPQLFGDFLDNCSIIDLLFNCGSESGEYIWGKYFQEFQKYEFQ